ncbi:hypothetical protein FQZ97_946790 [compost metagenome]
MTGTQEAANPVVRQRWLRAGRELVAGRAAQVGADADADKDLGLDRAVTVQRVSGSRNRLALRIGIGQLWLDFLQIGQLLFAAAHDPDGLATPFGHHLGAGQQAGNIHFNSRPCRLGSLGRLKRAHKRNGDGSCSHTTHGAGCDQPRAAAVVHSRINGCFTHEDLSMTVRDGNTRGNPALYRSVTRPFLATEALRAVLWLGTGTRLLT